MPQAPRSTSPHPVRIAWLEAILLIATFLRLSGQERLPDPGTRVRVTAKGLPAGRVSGVIQRWLPDTMVVARDSTGDTVRVPFGTVRRLEVSRGMQSGYDTGAEAGLVFGAGIDLLWIVASSRSGSEDPGIAAPFGIRGLVVLAGGFTALGALVGSLSRSERWQRVPLIVPLSHDRLGVGLSVGL
jgi:hypothetical protein